MVSRNDRIECPTPLSNLSSQLAGRAGPNEHLFPGLFPPDPELLLAHCRTIGKANRIAQKDLGHSIDRWQIRTVTAPFQLQITPAIARTPAELIDAARRILPAAFPHRWLRDHDVSTFRREQPCGGQPYPACSAGYNDDLISKGRQNGSKALSMFKKTWRAGREFHLSNRCFAHRTPATSVSPASRG